MAVPLNSRSAARDKPGNDEAKKKVTPQAASQTTPQGPATPTPPSLSSGSPGAPLARPRPRTSSASSTQSVRPRPHSSPGVPLAPPRPKTAGQPPRPPAHLTSYPSSIPPPGTPPRPQTPQPVRRTTTGLQPPRKPLPTTALGRHSNASGTGLPDAPPPLSPAVYKKILAGGTPELMKALRVYVYAQNPAAFHKIVAAGPEAMAEALRAHVGKQPAPPRKPTPRTQPTGTGTKILPKRTGFRVDPADMERPSKWANYEYAFQIIKESIIFVILMIVSIAAAWWAVTYFGSF